MSKILISIVFLARHTQCSFYVIILKKGAHLDITGYKHKSESEDLQLHVNYVTFDFSAVASVYVSTGWSFYISGLTLQVILRN